MIKSIQIRNYQSHRNTTLVLSTGITGIVGKSNTGKTAILRAIRWLIENRPAGYSFNSNFTRKKTSVISILEDDTQIKLTKGKGGPVYERDKTAFRKFGRTVPDLIQEQFNIGEINIQQQIEPPFLITSPPGKIAETINKVTKIEQIGRWIKEINSKTYKRRTKLGILEEDIEELEEELELLEPIEKIGTKIRKLQLVDKQLGRKLGQLAEVTGLLASIEATREDIKTAKRQLRVEKKVKALEKIEDQLLLLKREEDYIADYFIKAKDIKNATIAHKVMVKKYIRNIKRTKKCPYCIGPITDKVLERIEREVSIA